MQTVGSTIRAGPSACQVFLQSPGRSVNSLHVTLQHCGPHSCWLTRSSPTKEGEVAAQLQAVRMHNRLDTDARCAKAPLYANAPFATTETVYIVGSVNRERNCQ